MQKDNLNKTNIIITNHAGKLDSNTAEYCSLKVWLIR